MKNHVKRLHLGEEIKKTPFQTNKPLEILQCEHCGKDYSSPSALATHVKGGFQLLNLIISELKSHMTC